VVFSYADHRRKHFFFPTRTTHFCNLQPGKKGPWVFGFNFGRYGPRQGLGWGRVFAVALSPDSSAGFWWNMTGLTGGPSNYRRGLFLRKSQRPNASRAGDQHARGFMGSTLMSIRPGAPEKRRPQTRPAFAPRNLFDVSLGHGQPVSITGQKFKWELCSSQAIKVTNKTRALQFPVNIQRRTHYVTSPRPQPLEVGFPLLISCFLFTGAEKTHRSPSTAAHNADSRSLEGDGKMNSQAFST